VYRYSTRKSEGFDRRTTYERDIQNLVLRDDIKQENQKITTYTLHNDGIEVKNPYLKDLSTKPLFEVFPEVELGVEF
jgi:hypothetical protein